MKKTGLFIVIMLAAGLAVWSAMRFWPPGPVVMQGATVHTFASRFANVHLVTAGENSFLVDAGFEEDAPALAGAIREAGVEPESLRAVIVTHGHHDHAGGAAYFQRQYGTPVIAGSADAAMLAAGKNETLCSVGFVAQRRFTSDQGGTFTPVEADIYIDQTTDLSTLTGIAGRVEPLPGHTDGSLIVVLEEAALVGDLFRGDIAFNRSPRRHFYMCDIADNDADIRRLLDDLAPDATLFFTGHFGPIGRDALERFASRDN